MELTVKVISEEPSHHVDLAMGEVKHTEDAEHQGKPQGYQNIKEADHETIESRLQKDWKIHPLTFLRGKL